MFSALVCEVVAATVALITSIYLLRRFLQGPQFRQPDVRIDGKVCIITGCNTGIGKETALELARRGGRIYMACRDWQRCEQARQEVMAASGNSEVFNWHLDLSSQASIREFVKKFTTEETHLDILINNAATICERQLSVDGIEMQFATNHIGPFLLSNLLLDHLKRSAPSRIITVASWFHELVHLDRNDLQSEHSGTFEWTMAKVYGRTKLANILFTRELAHRLRGSGVTANTLHPGFVNTGIYRNTDWLMRIAFWPVLNMVKTTRSGAQTTIALALDPRLERTSGKHFYNSAPVQVSAQAQDEELGRWLWLESAKLCGFEGTY